MKTIEYHLLARISGGGDPVTQPLTMPPGWTPTLAASLPPWIITVGDYLKYLGIYTAA